jgi:hypothetical protein
MTCFSATVRISAVEGVAQPMPEAPVLRRSATPVRKIRTAVLISQEHRVPMTAIYVRMINVMEPGLVNIPITRLPVTTGCIAPRLTNVRVVYVKVVTIPA